MSRANDGKTDNKVEGGSPFATSVSLKDLRKNLLMANDLHLARTKGHSASATPLASQVRYLGIHEGLAVKQGFVGTQLDETRMNVVLGTKTQNVLKNYQRP